ncbi:MAG TPA: 6-carboxytetrahydropterin synthase [Cryomorphaceae bacterium]|nr:6-carboxytetrahydropterin synthase [Cryomorphaceae bacterium]
MATTVFRKAHFNAAHRLHNPAWSDEKNAEVFGKCSNPKYHGHNYNLIVGVTGPKDPETGFVVDLSFLNRLITELVVERFDHKNLNEETAEFANVNPTAENIAEAIWRILRPELDDSLALKVILYETERNFVEYTGP